jgi:CRISPR-associated protein Cas5h
MKLISFDVASNFGFFRKPETNNTLNVSYNMIHKPAILGLLGAVIGLKGYEKKDELPEYYQKLSGLKVGIAPLEHDSGNFPKTPIKYSNTVGYANKGSNFLTEELTLIAPKYKVYLLLDDTVVEQQKLYKNIKERKAEYIPYFGKNEFTAWWENFEEYQFELAIISVDQKVQIQTLFIKNQIISANSETSSAELDFLDFDIVETKENPFMYFERLPVGFDTELMQYKLEEMVFTNYLIKNTDRMPNVYQLNNQDAYVQLF